MEPGIAVGDVIKVEGATNAAGGVDAIRLSLERDSATEDGDPGVAPAHTPSPDEGNLEVSPTLTASLDGSLEPGDGETATESSVTPAHSGEGGNQTSEGNDQSSPTSHEDHSSDEINHTPQTDSGSKVD